MKMRGITLREYQREGVDQIHAFGGRAILADEMGLGKTPQAITFFMERNEWPVVIVCPAYLKLYWRNEIRRFTGIKPLILYGTKPYSPSQLRGERVIVLNYDILMSQYRSLRAIKPKVLIADEAHLLGNMSAQRTKAATWLTMGSPKGSSHKPIPSVVFLTGTPMTSSVFQLYPMLRMLMPEEYDSPFAFGMQYCEPEQSFGEWKFRGAKNLKELNRTLKEQCLIRRVKSDVAKELPEKIVTMIPMEVSNMAEYRRAESDVVAWLAETDPGKARRAMRAERLVRFAHLKRLAAQLKMKALREWLDGFLSESNDKMLMGTWHKSILEELATTYSKLCVSIHGGKSEKDRDLAQKKIRDGKGTRILFGQIAACGLGLNLPEVTNVAFAELPFSPSMVDQFIARCHRLTSKSTVNIYFLVAEGTIEEKICNILQTRQKIFDKAIDGRTDLGSLRLMDELEKVYRAQPQKGK